MASALPRLTFLCILVFVSSCTADAQEGQQKKRSFEYNPSRELGHFRDPVFRKVLSLPDEQNKRIDDLLSNWSKTLEEFNQIPREKRNRDQFDQLKAKAKAFEKQIDEILSEEQKIRSSRLQIAPWLVGGGRFWEIRDPGIQDELNLNDDQKQQIETLYEEWLKQTVDWWSDAMLEGKTRAQMLLLWRETAKEKWNPRTRKAILSGLTGDQRKRLEQIEFQLALFYEGPEVFITPDVQAELQITPEQLKDIQALADSIADKSGVQQVIAKSDGYKKCVALMNETQRKILTEKLGELYGLGVTLCPASDEIGIFGRSR